MGFSGQVAIVTGAARGLGLREATLLCESGAAVAICDILVEDGEAAARALREAGHDARFFRLDVTSDADWDGLVLGVLAWRQRIDVLVNNAGMLTRKLIGEYSITEWRRVLDVNLMGSWLGIAKVVPAMRQQGGGAIVNTASNTAYSGHPDAAYTASKWAVRGLTRSAAMEFAREGIRVNAVAPGLVKTEINRAASHVRDMVDSTPMGRAATADDIANTVLFLASGKAGMITGECIVVDGGFTAGGDYWGVSTRAGSYGTARL